MPYWKENDTIYIEHNLISRQKVFSYLLMRQVEEEKWTTDFYFVKNHRITKKTVDGYHSESKYDVNRIYEWLYLNGYDAKSIYSDFINKSVLYPIVGKTLDEADEHIKTLVALLHDRRKKREREKKQNNELKNKFNGYIIGLSRDFYTCSSGFSIRLLLSTGHTVAERKDFVKKYKKEIVKYALQSITENKKIIKAIGSIDYYKPVEIIICKSSEIEIKFEVKNISVFASPA